MLLGTEALPALGTVQNVADGVIPGRPEEPHVRPKVGARGSDLDMLATRPIWRPSGPEGCDKTYTAGPPRSTFRPKSAPQQRNVVQFQAPGAHAQTKLWETKLRPGWQKTHSLLAEDKHHFFDERLDNRHCAKRRLQSAPCPRAQTARRACKRQPVHEPFDVGRASAISMPLTCCANATHVPCVLPDLAEFGAERGPMAESVVDGRNRRSLDNAFGARAQSAARPLARAGRLPDTHKDPQCVWCAREKQVRLMSADREFRDEANSISHRVPCLRLVGMRPSHSNRAAHMTTRQHARTPSVA